MSDDAFVNKAANWADALVRLESRGPGDLENAMHRVARKTGVPYRTFWNLRYRRPKDIFTSVYFKLGTAYDAARQHQIERLTNDIETTAAVAGPDRASVRAAMALVGPEDGEEAQ